MFDVGFSELCLVGLVSLLVIGPEKLPQVARFVGFWIGKTRQMVSSVKQEFKEELYAEEVRQLLKQQEEMVEQLHVKGQEIKNLVADEVQQLQNGLVKPRLAEKNSASLLPNAQPPEQPSLTKLTLAQDSISSSLPSNIPTSSSSSSKRPKSKQKHRHGKK